MVGIYLHSPKLSQNVTEQSVTVVVEVHPQIIFLMNPQTT